MATPFIDFRPAQVMRNKEVYVSYYVLDPSSDSLKRMRIRCNRIKGRREQARYAARLCAEVNRRLYNGWNPLTGGDDTGPRKKVTIVEAASNYVRQKGKDLHKDTLRSYKSKLSYFTGWCERMGIAGWLCGRFTAAHAAGILDEYGRGRSAYSFNSMLQYLKGMFGAFVSAGHAAYNPFAAFKGRRREVKHRVTIPKQERRRILNYFHKRGMSGYVTMIRLCFRYLVRPKEILMLRMCDIDFDTGILHIPPEVSKNHSERTVALGHDVMRYFRELRQRGCAPDNYLFSTDFKPGARPYTTKNLFAVWQRMRESLSMPESYHFYSLKDTGITEMLESGMPSKFVKDLAGHHSLAMTERYTHVSDARRILEANKVRF